MSPFSSLCAFSESLVAGPLPDGYWVQAFDFNQNARDYPDIVAYGLGFKGAPSTIRLYINPLNDDSRRSSGWSVTEIASLEFPVGMTFADLTGNGYNDIIICDRYGPSMRDLWDAKTNNGGRVQWLENPKARAGKPHWQARHIGNSTGMHRLQAGHFTRSDVTQIMGLPIISKSDDFCSPAPVIIFTPIYEFEKGLGPTKWEESTVFESSFRMIHDAKLLPHSNDDGLDMVVVAGQEGIVLLWFNRNTSKWCFNVVGRGIPAPPRSPASHHMFIGSGSLEVCRVGEDDVGYIAACEAFHGHEVAVYVKSRDAPKGPSSLKSSKYWTRIKVGTYTLVGSSDVDCVGPLHHVTAVPLSGTTTESFAVACMGVPNGKGTGDDQGVYLYTTQSLQSGEFTKIKVSRESAARLAFARFSSNNNLLDIASITYYVPNYLTESIPPQLRVSSLPDYKFSATKLGRAVLLRIPRPTSLWPGSKPFLPFWRLAGMVLNLAVLPRNESDVLDSRIVAIKVIFGEITIKDKKRSKNETRRIAPEAKTVGSTAIPQSAHVTSGKNGVVFVAVMLTGDTPLKPIVSMDEVVSASALPTSADIPPDVSQAIFPFVKVEKLPWASNGLWDKFEFYNATGFHVYFNDDFMDRVAHIQAWTLGIGETARFHKHSETGRSFCEIHYCLINGGGTAGMRYFPDDFQEQVDQHKELTRDYVEQHTTALTVPSLYEHGPLWKRKEGTAATPQLLPNGSVDYPYHAWLASCFGNYKLPISPPLPKEKQSYDVWLAFEFPSSSFFSFPE